MDGTNSKANGVPDSSAYYSDIAHFIQGKTDEIMRLLEGVERDLTSRNRLGRYPVHETTSRMLDCKQAASKMIQGPAEQRGRSSTFEGHPEVSNTRNQGYRKMSKMTLPAGNEYDKRTEGSSIKRSPSVIGEKHEQKDQREITEKRKNVDKGKREDLWSYVDFSSSHPEVKWHKGQPELIPQNASPIGYTKTGKSLYAGRTWNEERSFLLPAYVDFEEGKCFYGKGGKLWTSTAFEVMESKNIAWEDAKGTPVSELPRFAYKAGYNEKDEPLYFGRAFIDGALTPGYIEQIHVRDVHNNCAFALIIPFRGNVLRIFDTYEVMVVIPFNKH